MRDVEHQIYIFTQSCWQHDKSLYPDVKFIETPGEKYDYRHFWRDDIPPYIKDYCPEDVFLLVEQDQWFIRPVTDLVNYCHNDQTIVLNNEIYSASITIDGLQAYPRVWEGGVIFPRSFIIDAVKKHGVNLGGAPASDFVCDRLKLCKKECIGPKPLNTFVKGHYWDTMIEMCFYCYFQNLPVSQHEMVVHFNPTEQIHRRHRSLYDHVVTSEAVKEAEKRDNVFNALFMFYMSGVCSLNDVLMSVFKRHSKQLMKRIAKLDLADQWMSDIHLRRLADVRNCCSPSYKPTQKQIRLIL